MHVDVGDEGAVGGGRDTTGLQLHVASSANCPIGLQMRNKNELLHTHSGVICSLHAG